MRIIKKIFSYSRLATNMNPHFEKEARDSHKILPTNGTLLGKGGVYVCPKSDFENLLFHMLRRKLCSIFVKHDHVKGTVLSRAAQIKRKKKTAPKDCFWVSIDSSPSLRFFFFFWEERGEEECLIHFFHESSLPPLWKKININTGRPVITVHYQILW